jgi:hypothetical protein
VEAFGKRYEWVGRVNFPALEAALPAWKAHHIAPLNAARTARRPCRSNWLVEDSYFASSGDNRVFSC